MSESQTYARERPVGGFELWSWLFMRISGLVLVVLAVGHVLLMHVVDEGVDRVNFAFVQLRWQSPFWRAWDWMLLCLARTASTACGWSSWTTSAPRARASQ